MYIPINKENEKLPDLFESEDRDACLQQPGGIYCMVQLILYEGPVRFLYNSTQADSEKAITTHNNLKINTGVCLTTTCRNYVQNTGLEINKGLENSLERCISTAMLNKYNLFTKAYNIGCDTHLNEGYRIDSIDYIVAVIFIALILVNVIGSCYDIFHKNKDEKNYKTGHELLLCFSIFRNSKQFSSEVFTDINSRIFRDIHVIRTITACSLVYVNIIFMGHAILKHTQLRKLAAPTALVIAFSATWLRNVSSRSQWIHNTTEHCRSHYWAHLFYYNNHLPNNTICSFQTWYMTADTQLNALGLFIRFILKDRSSTFKGVTFALLLSIGIASPMVHIWFQDLDVLQRPEIYSVLYELTFLKLHVLPHNNLICFIMSMATGYLVSYLLDSKTEWLNWKFGRFLCLCVVPGIALVVSWSGGGWWGAVLSGASAAAVGTLCSLWFLGTAMKFNDLSALFNGRGFVVLSKLSYSVFLLHPIVVFLVFDKTAPIIHENFVNTNIIFIVVLLATYALAGPFYILVEAPSIQIIKLAIRNKLPFKCI